ncbi:MULTISPECIES: hypothetical protein [Luteimonas]|uniref:hypothetical protein n=1 Tax=Luteimonas TaxID=83614 RepID=UPI0011808702|nr:MULTISPECIES: hypothetical protein [Luteimonas]
MKFSFFKQARIDLAGRAVGNVAPFDELRSHLFEIGGVLMDRDETSARFALNLGWSINVAFERYGQDFTISLFDHGTRTDYAIWILMEVFEVLRGKQYGPPTIENQVEFLKNEGTLLFGDPGFYASAYRERLMVPPPRSSRG